MRWIWMTALALGLSGPAFAWELVDPDRVEYGATSTTRVLDVTYFDFNGQYPPAERPRQRGFWVRFADPDVGAICRRLGLIPPDDPDPGRRLGHAWKGEYVYLRYPGDNQNASPPQLAAVLFAKAHNLSVKVRVFYDSARGFACYLGTLQTCSAQGSCD